MYKHPKWQKKRLEILDRDGFKCKLCGATENQLHVHHKYYDNAIKLWEYPGESLVTLCNECHKTVHRKKKDLDDILWKFDFDVFDALRGLLLSMMTNPGLEKPIIYNEKQALGFAIGSHWHELSNTDRQNKTRAAYRRTSEMDLDS